MVSLLRVEGIVAVLDGDASHGWNQPMYVSRVIVRRADAERALELLREQGLLR